MLSYDVPGADMFEPLDPDVPFSWPNGLGGIGELMLNVRGVLLCSFFVAYAHATCGAVGLVDTKQRTARFSRHRHLKPKSDPREWKGD